MEIELKLNVGSFSVNNAYYMRNKKYNANARKYRKQFLTSLTEDANKESLRRIRRSFNKKQHHLKVTFYFHYPTNILTTKEGSLSRRAKDIDNCLKLPIDFLCQAKYMNDSKYLEELAMKEIVNLGIDDQYISEVRACKRPSLSGKEYLVIKIQRLDLSQLTPS